MMGIRVDLTKVDDRAVPNNPMECRVFSVIKNEIVRLPYMLTYYRKLGIERFFIVDDNSTDGSLDFLNEQVDCHVFQTTESFLESNHGTNWINKMVEDYGKNNWCMNIDADECLIYPDCEHISLPSFCGMLNAEGSQGLYAFLLDMYSKKPIAEAHYTPDTDFLDTCSYFDRDYFFRRRFGLNPFPTHEPIGGPRLRCFFPEFVGSGLIHVTTIKALRAIREKTGIKREISVPPPLLLKIPLMHGSAGFWRSSHITTRIKLSKTRGVLLHFKYFSDFHQRVIQARMAGQNYNGGVEYARYLAALQNDPKISFYYANSEAYQDSTQIVRLGLMRI